MDLIVNQMVQLQVIHIAHGDGIIKQLSGSAASQPGLSVLGKAGLPEALENILFR